MPLTSDETLRYGRQLLLNEVGNDGQETLKATSVLVVGAGGLGCPILLYLASAGVGRLTVVDGDVVDVSNLHRQILFSVNDLGMSKAVAAVRNLKTLNPHVKVTAHVETLRLSNAMTLVANHDIVVDATDNFPAKYLLNDACVLAGKPLVYGSISQFEGQAAVFNADSGPNYRDLFPVRPPANLSPSCAEAGVLGVLPGMVGMIQATEVLKLALGIGDTLSGTLLLVDALSMRFRRMQIKSNPDNPLRAPFFLDDHRSEYQISCQTNLVYEISIEAFEQLRRSGEGYILLDVRDEHEIGDRLPEALHIPLNALQAQLSTIKIDKRIIVYCKSGMRSRIAAQLIQAEYPGCDVTSLSGGIDRHRLQGA